ncbi:MAG: hypothetical protein NVSMB56_17290 [Pyrinomonadaceae bacterium]
MPDEMEIEWQHLLDEATRRALANGRGDVAAYLALRALNDAARNVGIEWLLRSFIAPAEKANRAGVSIQIEQTDAHRFHVGASTMVGARLILRAGMRQLTLEAGYPRAPADGIVRGGGLACALVTHYGRPRANVELLLARATVLNAPPQWVVLEESGTRTPFVEADLRRHFATLCEQF